MSAYQTPQGKADYLQMRAKTVEGEVAFDEYEWQLDLTRARIKHQLREIKARIKDLEKASSFCYNSSLAAAMKNIVLDEPDLDDEFLYDIFSQNASAAGSSSSSMLDEAKTRGMNQNNSSTFKESVKFQMDIQKLQSLMSSKRSSSSTKTRRQCKESSGKPLEKKGGRHVPRG